MTVRTLPINTRTVPVGVTTFGPLPIGNNSSAVISIDRTIAGGFNSLDSNSVMELLLQTSVDGTTWNDLCGATWPGGIVITGHGQMNTNSVGTGDVPDAATAIKAIATVTGPSSIVIVGSITVT